jgi:ABC-type branched-subunit amino acid transport system substrate-binding protein
VYGKTRLGALLLSFAVAGCGGPEAPAPTPEGPEEAVLKVDKGVDADKKVIKIGTLDDLSGPAATISKPFANGKRLLAARINAGDSGFLPEGWTVELIERDHGYNPTKSVAAYNEIKEDVLFIGTSFGTPNTLPLRPLLEQDGMAAFPASLSSQMAAHLHTPPLGPAYELEARRAVDWIAATAPNAKLGIVYQKDDYGEDGLLGFTAGAKHHKLEIVSEQTVAPGQKDFAAVVTGLKDAGATHVMMTTLPSATGPILGTAAQLEYMPVWIGNTPAWIDKFFVPEVIPSVVFTNYHQMNGLPFWGEPVPGMDDFLKAWETHGTDMGDPDSYTVWSYIQGMVQIEAARRAIEAGDITRAGYMTSLRSIDGWDAGGMFQPLSLAGFPYVVGTKTRVLKPDFEKKSWTVVADYATAWAPAPAAPEGAAPEGAEGGE